MSKKLVSVEVSSACYDVSLAVCHFAAVCYKAGKDGFQPGQDVPEVLAALTGGLLPVMSKVKEVPAEVAADSVASVAALALAAKEAYDKLPK